MSADSKRDPLGISGTIIADKYRMEQVIGEGGFSVVYRAEHTIWQQPVAIKCFKVLSNAPEDQRNRLLDGFIQEGKLMAQLSSRSAAIVQARDIGTFTTRDGQWIPYMVLEWLEGKPLDVVLWEEKRAGLPPRALHEVLALLEPAAVALEIAHSRGVAHRDLKPANFFVLGDPRGPQPHVKVLDFGIAKVMADHAAASAAAAHTGNEITSFTPQYGAPEQFSRTHGATGPWTDVFAMALILIEIMRGGVPALDGNDFVQMALVSRDPTRRPTPRSFGLEVPDPVEQVFLKALAVAPVDRFASMGQLWAALMSAVFPEAPTWSVGTTTGVGGPARAFTGSMPGSPISAPMPAHVSVPIPSSPGVGPFTPAQALAATTALPQSDTALGASISSPSATRAIPPPSTPSSGSGVRVLAIAGGAILALGVGGFIAVRTFAGPGPAPEVSATPAATGTSTEAAAAPTVTAAATASSAARRDKCPDDMVLVPGGKFFMGSDEGGFKLWQPSHKVTLDTFCIDKTEVTAAAYKACSDIGECKRAPTKPDYPKLPNESDQEHQRGIDANAELCNFGKPDRDNHPINCVDWELADSYCKVKKKRLPTEAEWEFAARGSDGRKFPWGDNAGRKGFMNACGLECNKWEVSKGLKPTVPRMYEFDDGFYGTAPVGSFPKGRTRFGADDFVGNVWEWTADWFETYKPDEVVNPKGAAAGDRKAIRGGGYNGGVALWLNPAFRYHQLATASAPAIGFRCALTL
jgi:eukaryotic-like serine/threonine-protein kinase